ncbi:thermonuclease family protein [Rhizobium sp. RAF56]|jgi:endonuclease YncB( thermonuclease family)|uniref:thermonuclease family protein n=1 Tax=Rhizobium sp. RAF56 TaxID=3233062 RepID=UPI003F975BD7
MICFKLVPTLAIAILSCMPAYAGSGDMIAGPVSARIVRVIDGDTLLVDANPWPQQTIEVYVRLRGIDAPELHAHCETTRHAAEQAQAALQEMTATTEAIELSHISGDKYFGRILADVTLGDGRNPARYMLAAGYATAYDGGRKPIVHCPDEN